MLEMTTKKHCRRARVYKRLTVQDKKTLGVIRRKTKYAFVYKDEKSNVFRNKFFSSRDNARRFIERFRDSYYFDRLVLRDFMNDEMINIVDI